MNLLWHLKEILKNLPFKHVLDIGASVSVSKNICLPECVEKAVIVDPDSEIVSNIIHICNDDRLEALEGGIEAINLEDRQFDMVFFIMSLLWVDDPRAALQKAISKSPAYIVIANPVFSPEQLKRASSCFRCYKDEFIEKVEKYYARALDIDEIMQSSDYYPLVVFRTISWSPTPEHSLRTVLYTKEKPDRIPYDNAKYIIQVNSKCNCNCPACYVVKTGDDLEAAVFKTLIEDIHENETISLRGGEPTLTENLIEGYIHPALDRGINVILESNGLFIGSAYYQRYLEILTSKNIQVRLSLDREHIDLFPERIRLTKIGWISKFIYDAEERNIKFGLFSLGMSREQVMRFLSEYSVESWIGYIRPLTKYSDITELPIRGKFIDVDGKIHDHITGVGWIGTPDEDSLGK
ncbi:MAG: methyltransferase domain-containing protein [Syntrophales bacterium]|nr:methyltransferase domain-containing protein [Syntrophales bacterium]